MPGIKVHGFGGMIPVQDDRLLPDSNAADAANVWIYGGDLQGFRDPINIHTLVNPATRYIFRVPKNDPQVRYIRDSYFLEFQVAETTVVKSPVSNASDPTYYWADGVNPPGYTSVARLAAASAALVLGIPAPGTAPAVVPAGGVSTTNSTRAYVYTWVSAYGEEGPPSNPTTATGKIDDTWGITLTAPTAGDTTNRNLTHTNIYRTITNSQGQAEYHFVAQVVIATLVYNDTRTEAVVAADSLLLSANWSAPPTDLKGIVPMANGMLVGWRGNEIWFAEPNRPHAWPPQYVQSIEYNIVGMSSIDQTVVAGTEAFPYYGTGVSPLAVTLRRIPAAEPCISRASFVATPRGIYYASPNGLIFVTPGAAVNVTLPTISVDKWATLLNLAKLHAGIVNEAYYVFSGLQENVFEPTAFEPTAFQQQDFTGTRDGLMIDFQSQRVGVTRLTSVNPTYNIMQDSWTGLLLMIRDGALNYLDLTSTAIQGNYLWKSKIFTTGRPVNFSACKVTWQPPNSVSQSSTIKFYVDGTLRFTKTVPADKTVFKMPSGFKGVEFQFQVEGNLLIKSVEMATSVKELAGV